MKHENVKLFCNEAQGAPPETPDPSTVVIVNEHGQPIPGAESDPEIVIPNASTVLGGTAVDHLTTFVQGLPMGEIEQVADFLSPRLDAGLAYEYELEPDANQFGRVDNDIVGYNGLPGIIQLDPRTKTTGQLMFRGLELPYGHTDQALDASVPGRSVAWGEERRTRRVNAFIERGRLARLLALLDANVSGSNINFKSDNDPINAVDDVITLLSETCACPRSWIRMLWGTTAWKYMRQHAFLTGGGAFARVTTSKAWICDALEVAQDQLMVCSVQATTSKQGKTHAKAMILGGTTINFFVQPPASQPEDPAWAKTFAMRLKGGFKYAYRNTTHAALNVYNVGVAYYEDMKCTNADAVLQRTAVIA